MKSAWLLFIALCLPSLSAARSFHGLVGVIHEKTSVSGVSRSFLTNVETTSEARYEMTGLSGGYLNFEPHGFGVLGHFDIERLSNGFKIFDGSFTKMRAEASLIYAVTESLFPFLGLNSEMLLQQVASDTWNQAFLGFGWQVGIGAKFNDVTLEVFKTEATDKMFDIFRSGSTRQSSGGIRVSYAFEIQ